MWALSLLLGLLVVLAITAATGYFVAQEFAYMTVDRSRLTARAEAGDAAARRALAVTRRTSFMLSGAQLGITVTALLVGYVAEPLVGESVGTALGGVGVPTGVGVAIGTVAALLLSTGVQMVFGELFPKNLAIARPEQTAIALARSTTIYLAGMGWLIAFFDKASNALLRLFGMEPVHDVEHSATRRDLAHIVTESRASGDLPADLSVLLDRLVEFPDRDAEHAMVPRARVGTVTDDTRLDDLWHTMGEGHSRYPVLDEQGDVVGVVHLQDLLAEPRRAELHVRDIMREPLLVPTVMPLTDVLGTLTASRRQLACVLDEHGGLAGVVTLEDLAEELVGEIDDEHDLDAPELPEAAPDAGATSWDLAGTLPLDEVERVVGRDLPAGEHETLGGLVIACLGRLPEVGDRTEVQLASLPSGDDDLPERLDLEVLEVERHVPALVRISHAAADEEVTA
ncbi:hemolysin family protein [Nocardioides litoris]|uniref:hemolysin family protein n=1 Tax=Nocardioides litoris TaxID=1926648 RepID=UPI001124223B|nr:hemolysin family protein [Nocardioides litoris]